jgi:hypothetical protein
MKITTIVGILVSWLVSSPAYADDIQSCMGRQHAIPRNVTLVCSGTWQFTGPCDGVDLWDRWKVQGQTTTDEPFVRPFLDDRIVVIGYEMTKVGGEPHSFFMIGSGIQNDAFLWMPPGRNHARIMFPSGVGHPWPSKTESEAQRNSVNDLIDIHGSCNPIPSPPPLVTARPVEGWLDRVARFFKPRAAEEPVAAVAAPAAQPAAILLTIYFTPWSRISSSPAVQN